MIGTSKFRIQGLRGRYTQILSDGLPLYGEATGLGPLQIPPMDLGRVEVIKGAASALYGSSALGGVINLISRRPDGAVELLPQCQSVHEHAEHADQQRRCQDTLDHGGLLHR